MSSARTNIKSLKIYTPLDYSTADLNAAFKSLTCIQIKKKADETFKISLTTSRVSNFLEAAQIFGFLDDFFQSSLKEGNITYFTLSATQGKILLEHLSHQSYFLYSSRHEYKRFVPIRNQENKIIAYRFYHFFQYKLTTLRKRLYEQYRKYGYSRIAGYININFQENHIEVTPSGFEIWKEMIKKTCVTECTIEADQLLELLDGSIQPGENTPLIALKRLQDLHQNAANNFNHPIEPEEDEGFFLPPIKALETFSNGTEESPQSNSTGLTLLEEREDSSLITIDQAIKDYNLLDIFPDEEIITYLSSLHASEQCFAAIANILQTKHYRGATLLSNFTLPTETETVNSLQWFIIETQKLNGEDYKEKLQIFLNAPMHNLTKEKFLSFAISEENAEKFLQVVPSLNLERESYQLTSLFAVTLKHKLELKKQQIDMQNQLFSMMNHLSTASQTLQSMLIAPIQLIQSYLQLGQYANREELVELASQTHTLVTDMHARLTAQQPLIAFPSGFHAMPGRVFLPTNANPLPNETNEAPRSATFLSQKRPRSPGSN